MAAGGSSSSSMRGGSVPPLLPHAQAARHSSIGSVADSASLPPLHAPAAAASTTAGAVDSPVTAAAAGHLSPPPHLAATRLVLPISASRGSITPGKAVARVPSHGRNLSGGGGGGGGSSEPSYPPSSSVVATTSGDSLAGTHGGVPGVPLSPVSVSSGVGIGGTVLPGGVVALPSHPGARSDDGGSRPVVPIGILSAASDDDSRWWRRRTQSGASDDAAAEAAEAAAVASAMAAASAAAAATAAASSSAGPAPGSGSVVASSSVLSIRARWTGVAVAPHHLAAAVSPYSGAPSMEGAYTPTLPPSAVTVDVAASCAATADHSYGGMTARTNATGASTPAGAHLRPVVGPPPALPTVGEAARGLHSTGSSVDGANRRPGLALRLRNLPGSGGGGGGGGGGDERGGAGISGGGDAEAAYVGTTRQSSGAECMMAPSCTVPMPAAAAAAHSGVPGRRAGQPHKHEERTPWLTRVWRSPLHHKLAAAAMVAGILHIVAMCVRNSGDATGLGSGKTLAESLSAHAAAYGSFVASLVALVLTSTAAATSRALAYADVAAAHTMFLALAALSTTWYGLHALFGIVGHWYLDTMFMETYQMAMWFAVAREVAGGCDGLAPWLALAATMVARVAAFVVAGHVGLDTEHADTPGVLLVRFGDSSMPSTKGWQAGVATTAVVHIVAEAALVWVALQPHYFARFRTLRGQSVMPLTRYAVASILLAQLLTILYGAVGWGEPEARIIYASIRVLWYVITASTLVGVLSAWRVELAARKTAEAEAETEVRLSRSVADARAQIIRWGMHELRVPFNSLQLGIEDMKESLRAGEAWTLPTTLGLMTEAATAMDRVLVRTRARISGLAPFNAHTHQTHLRHTMQTDVLLMQKLESGAVKAVPQPTTVRRLVASSLRLMHQQLEMAGFREVLDVAANVPYRVALDPQRVTQILTNYLRYVSIGGGALHK